VVAQILEVVDQVADREVGGVALAVVAVLLARLEIGFCGSGKDADLVAEPAQPNNTVVVVRSALVKGRSVGRRKCGAGGWCSPASCSKRSRSRESSWRIGSETIGSEIR
jgi:hypothetical protein